MRTIKQIKTEIEKLSLHYHLCNDSRIAAILNQLKAENEPQLVVLRAELKTLQSNKKITPRWPENTPEDILKLCRDYWSGTTESYSFRIHQWNEKAVWTSYPSGGYSTVGGWTSTPPAFILISRTERESGNRIQGRPKQLKEIRFEFNSGKRCTNKMRIEALSKL